MIEWFKAHPYSTASLTTGFVLVLGTLFVIHRTAGPQQSGTQAWGGSLSGVTDPQSYTPNPVLEALQEPQLGTGGYSGTFLPVPPPAPLDGGSNTTDTGLASIIASLVATYSTSTTTQMSTSSQVDSYSFIPQGLIATTSTNVQRTPEEQALYEYGNEVGSYIKTFESQFPGVPQALDDQARDRYNSEKGDRVRVIGQGLAAVGANLKRMEQIPKSVTTLHAALADSYVTVGDKLSAIPDAKSDEAFLAAVETYNTASENFAKRFVNLADFFVISNVRFSSGDSGSVFTFSFGGGL